MAAVEERVTDPDTGGEKGRKLARFSLIPKRALWALAEHYGKCGGDGRPETMKYEDRNWERGYDWSLSFDAMMRHAWSWWGGEDIDLETGTHHLICSAWHCFCLFTFGRTHVNKDDRPHVDRGCPEEET